MPYLSINNFALPIAIDTPRKSVEEIGGRAIALDGTEVSDIRARKRDWQMKTIPVIPALEAPIVGLVLGEGHSWDFESSAQFEYSGKGLGITSSSGATRQTSAPNFGTAHLQLAATTGSFVVDPQLSNNWTAMVWRDTGAGYAHYLETSTGLYMADGVVSASQAWFGVAAGVLTLSNTTGGTVDFDDLVVLPYAVEATMGAAFGTMTSAFGVAPLLLCEGDFAGGDAVTAVGSNPQSSYTAGVRSGAWYNALAEVTFRLREDSAVQGNP